MNAIIVSRFKEYFENIKVSDPSLLNEIYSEDVLFVDPYCQIVGIESLKFYFKRMNQRIYDCRMVFAEQATVEDKIHLQWEMNLTLKPFMNKAKVSGLSVLTIKDKVVKQMDYFNKRDLMFSDMILLEKIFHFLKSTGYEK